MLQHKTTVNRTIKTPLLSGNNRGVKGSVFSRAIQAGLDLLQHILLLIAFLMFFSYVQVATAAEQNTVTGLLVNNTADKQEQWIQASHTELEMRIAELNNQVTLRQVFHISSLDQLTGKYIFSLHKDAQLESVQIASNGGVNKNVDSSSFTAGGESARYEIEVTLVNPEELLEFRIHYQQPVKYEKGKFQLSVPMMENADVNLHIELDAGFAISELTSPSHAIHTVEHGSGKYSVRFQDGIIPANHNFELIWIPEADGRPVPVDLQSTKFRDASPFVARTDNIIHLSAQTATDSQLKLVVGLLCVFLALLVRFILFRLSPGSRWSDRRMSI